MWDLVAIGALAGLLCAALLYVQACERLKGAKR